jgi:hypothetical protein
VHCFRSIAINHLLAETRGSNIGLAFLYCEYKEQTKQTVSNLLASLLKQFTQQRPSLCDSLADLYGWHSNRETRLSIEEISGALRVAVASFSKVFIVIDAVDECCDEWRVQLLTELQNLSVTVNLMMTSRPHTNLGTIFRQITKAEIRASDQDLQTYINGRISWDPRLSLTVKADVELHRRVMHAITNTAKGMYVSRDGLEFSISPCLVTFVPFCRRKKQY